MKVYEWKRNGDGRGIKKKTEPRNEIDESTDRESE